MHDLAVKLSTILLRIAGRLMPQDEAPWLQAMRAELHHVEGAGEKLAFAGGCIKAALSRAIATGATEQAIRIMMIPALLIWSGTKFYLWLILPNERLVPLASEMISISAIGYTCTALWLLRRNPLAALTTLSVPLIANVLHFGMTARIGYIDEIALLSLAVIAEEFAIWIAAALGLAAILILPRIRTGQHS